MLINYLVIKKTVLLKKIGVKKLIKLLTNKIEVKNKNKGCMMYELYCLF